jgi:acetylornithine deacetylase
MKQPAMSKFLEPIELISKLVKTPSISSVSRALDMGNLKVIELLSNWLDDLGFTIAIQSLGHQRDKANMIAKLGHGEEGLVLAGHTDTVPYDEGRWHYEPFKLTMDNGRLYGLGTADMKSFLGLAVVAAQEFKARDLKHPLTILATADEESGMDGAKWVAESGVILGRYAVIGEPTNLIPVRQHKGILMEAIRLRGQSGHSSDPRHGNSALEGMHVVIRTLLDYRRKLQLQYHNPAFDVPVPTLNLGSIHGGDNPNRICGECELQIDMRPLPSMNLYDLRHTFRTEISKIAKRLGLICEFDALLAGVPAMETPTDSRIVRLAEKLTGHPSAAVAFATEGPFLQSMGIETVILGPGDITHAHQPDEYLSVDRIQPMLKMLSNMIKSVCMNGE